MVTLLISFWLSPGIGCTPDMPYPTTVNSICTGYGVPNASCKLSNAFCSPVPGVPGTWNPDGYTPKGYWNE